MGARTLLYRLMVISPIALITWIVGTGRFSADTFEFSAATRQQHEAIDAYRSVVRATTPFRARGYTPEPDEIRGVAAKWIEGRRSGELRPLTPAYLADSIQTGVKSEIRACQAVVAVHLYKLALREEAAGNPEQAVQDLITCMEISQILRSSDALAESACCQELNLALAKIRSLAGQLPAEQLRQVQAHLIEQRDGAPSLERLIRQTAVLMQQSEPELNPLEKWGTVIAQAKSRGTMSVVLTDFMASKPKSIRDMPGPVAQLYLGIRARQGLDREIDAALNEISVFLNPEQGIRVASLP